MPTYDYRCGHCGHAAEVFQKMTDAKLTRCPKCKRAAFNREIGRGIAVNRALYGSEAESAMFRINPAQVGEMRRRFSDKARGAIRDDGSVVYNDKAQAKAFGREWDSATAVGTVTNSPTA